MVPSKHTILLLQKIDKCIFIGVEVVQIKLAQILKHWFLLSKFLMQAFVHSGLVHGLNSQVSCDMCNSSLHLVIHPPNKGFKLLDHNHSQINPACSLSPCGHPLGHFINVLVINKGCQIFQTKETFMLSMIVAHDVPSSRMPIIWKMVLSSTMGLAMV